MSESQTNIEKRKRGRPKKVPVSEDTKILSDTGNNMLQMENQPELTM